MAGMTDGRDRKEAKCGVVSRTAAVIAWPGCQRQRGVWNMVRTPEKRLESQEQGLKWQVGVVLVARVLGWVAPLR